MPTKKWVSAGFIAALLAASLLMLNASTPEKEKATCCKKAIKKCSGSMKSDTPEATKLENLSHQFITLPFYFH